MFEPAGIVIVGQLQHAKVVYQVIVIGTAISGKILVNVHGLTWKHRIILTDIGMCALQRRIFGLVA